ncbi:helix-turn-helix transcriptional regulator [Streptococcus iniae]|nr:helix-turn-helix transcriptional regulator [Streptococcus iniae]WLR88545.1 helix-turn-helix transcriptional regulator [Streptococcus iniae]
MSLGNKEVFAKNLNRFMERRGIDRNKLVEDLGFKYTTVTDWTIGRTYPRIDKIEMLANYFGVQKSDLIEDKEPRREQTIDLKDVLNRTVAFDGHTLDENDAELIKSLLENMVKNKE